ncbi:hypothetical protein NE237_000430 [Protea cynaroides]|uniref:Uncharacterized protein n=1 Tax=Protea cynaroides TaxID=273540 RepID=A0A9Q0KS68_9MAGN|nr:hypothetical protein NE237_000430 [Protea cynaroides]
MTSLCKSWALCGAALGVSPRDLGRGYYLSVQLVGMDQMKAAVGRHETNDSTVGRNGSNECAVGTNGTNENAVEEPAFKKASGEALANVTVGISNLVDCQHLLASRSLFNIPFRQLHLLNFICRRVILSEFRADVIELVQVQNISIARYWLPAGGVEQMEQWVSINQEWVQNQLKFLRFVLLVDG